MQAKKKILIIGPGMELGGVERSLLGLLDAFDYSQVDVDVFLFRHSGELMSYINPNVRLLPENKFVADYYTSLAGLLKRGRFLSVLVKLVSIITGRFNHRILRSGISSHECYQIIISKFIRKIDMQYDIGLGFIDPHYYLINNFKAKIKVGWLHTDPKTIWSNIIHGNMPESPWQPLDYIACVSKSIKDSFDEVLPRLASKTIVIENVLSTSFVKSMANEFVPKDEMDEQVFKILSVKCEPIKPSAPVIRTDLPLSILHTSNLYDFTLNFQA